MTSIFEVPVSGASGLTDAELAVDYDALFDEHDFQAMGINPSSPTLAKPGSQEKVVMLAARYASGLPLWHNDDRYDHGPDRMAESGNETAFVFEEEDE